ncbi:hypothetical protein A3C26_04265 [Candidatus Daviesbacteria bacterium RIFCSPHIGHO2_02_FULL_39_12]|uniref:Uncharacterized protein n=2 Tax=Candidatus Daviesiibacteriota TaxID=1752718 RepID=A0A1F5JD73_9BACT|nr:MAG: hypothetical protein A3C26_04265 [Candidatus Daviesbacteria bacterium RIFCSPHIGHO2_02_FULL_39_12]OGE71581.1 MAG: hypothetical protein A3H40_03885 [Candidatus Daviesbacteria bacterium RIFCSPLOWO2_02_FULL_38_15]
MSDQELEASKQLVNSDGLKRVGVDEARKILEAILSVDPETVRSLDDFSKFVGLPDATTAITVYLLLQMQISECDISPFNYINWKENNTDNHYLAVTFSHAYYALVGLHPTYEQKLSAISHYSPAEVYLHSKMANGNTFSAVLRLEQFSEIMPPVFYASFYESGDISRSVNIKFGDSSQKSEDYQTGARGVQRFAGTLLKWNRSTSKILAPSTPNLLP